MSTSKRVFQNRPWPVVALLSLVFLLAACKDSGDDDAVNFDRTAMLSNYADNLIIPAFAEAAAKAQDLEAAWQAFLGQSGETELLACRDAWLDAILAWQEASLYNIGPAGEEGLSMALVQELSTFPVDAALIEDYIDAGDYSLDNSDRDTRGFLALDYLLFGDGDDLAMMVAGLSTTERQSYVSAVIEHLVDELERVDAAWDGYRTEFVDSDGTSVGSSTSLLYNEFLKSFELLKNLKVALPTGKQAGQTGPEPELVEAYYSGHSLTIIEEHLAALERVYYGRSVTGTDGSGLEDYLQEVVGGPELVSLTENQWSSVLSAYEAVPATPALSELAETENIELSSFHTELQKQTRYFKSDMSSLLGIAITFDSGDGD